MSTLNTFQQFVLFVLLMLGSVVWVSIAIIQIRKTIFLRKIRKILADIDAPADALEQRISGARSRTIELVRETLQTNGIEAIPEQGYNDAPVSIGNAVQDVPVAASPKRCVKSKTPTAQQCTEIGGIEYRALCLLTYIVPTYFILCQFFGCIGIGWWISVHKPEVPLENGLNPWWMGSFNAVSAFNNSGMSLLDKNMVCILHLCLVVKQI